MAKKATKIIMATCAGILIGWDVYVAVNGVPGDTISELTLGWAQNHPIIPMAVGVVCGHLFWPQRAT